MPAAPRLLIPNIVFRALALSTEAFLTAFRSPYSLETCRPSKLIRASSLDSSFPLLVEVLLVSRF